MVLPKSLEEIGDYAFYGQNRITVLYVSPTVNKVGNAALPSGPTLTIYGIKNSFAETYAKDNNNTFIAMNYPYIKAESLSMKAGTSQQLTAIVYTSLNTTTTGVIWTLNGNNDDETTIDESGLISIAEGETSDAIDVTGTYNNVAASIQIQISSSGKMLQEIEVASDIQMFYGDEPFSLDVVLAKGNGDLSYASNNEDIVSINESGIASIHGAGEAVIIVTASETEDYDEASAEIHVSVAKAVRDISASISQKQLLIGETAEITVNGPVQFKSLNDEIVKVTADGVVEAISPGTAIVEITLPETDNEVEAKTEIEVFVIEDTHIHVLTEVPEIPATCITDGTEAYWKCSGCGRIFSDEEGTAEISEPVLVKANGHLWSKEYMTDKKPTCKEAGSESFHCVVCDTVKEDSCREINKLQHSYGEWETIKAATCIVEGVREKVCSVCDDRVEEVIPVTEHSWNETFTIDKPATCTEEGSKSIHCSVCGEKKDVTAVRATGHTWEENYTVDKEATTDEEGSESIHCAVCGEVQEGSERVIEKHPQNVAPTPSETSTPSVTSTPTVDPTPIVTPTPTVSPWQKSEDGTAVGRGASTKSAAAAITAASSDEGPSGTSFVLLQPRVKKTTKSSIRIAWAKVPGAVEYIVYGAPCGNKYKEIRHVTRTSYTQTKLKKATSYKYMVMAVSTSDTVISTSKTIHIMTDGGKRSNYKSIKVNKKSVILAKKGKIFKIKAKVVAKPGKIVKAHRRLAYESTDPTVATVSKSGKIKAVKKGKCNVLVYAADGTFAKIAVTVK